MTRRLVSAKSPANVEGGADRRPPAELTPELTPKPEPGAARAVAGRALPGLHAGVGVGRGRTGEMWDVSAGPAVCRIRCFSLSYLTHQFGSGSRESLSRKR